ncbi:corticotropin releasing hormone b [Tachysurus fulvidraco]|uniref:corticotropin releasing hormone b n=1 Tax=Tachysurus fulvidraco TaxID=1234273 RepID=UPI000F4DD3C0|nr:corticotropin releasing hormone b [Tachysurus fulvidraco]
MKLHFLVTTAAALLVAFPPRMNECRAVDGPDQRASLSANALEEEEDQRRTRPIWARLGEEYFIRVGNGNKREREFEPETRPEPESAVFKRALQLRLTQHLLREEDEVAEAARGLRDAPAERPRRAEEPPISLDLTFHLLREVLEMAKAEQLAQQAHSNRKMMEIFGK